MPASHKPSRFRRKLSPTERYNLVINENYRYILEAVIEGEGILDQAEWQRAVDMASEANPGARLRLKGAFGFCYWIDSGISPKVRVVENSRWNGRNEQHTEFSHTPFNPLNHKSCNTESEGIADVILLPAANDGGKSRILVRVLHAAMDARGAHHWINDIFNALQGKTLTGSKDTFTDLDVLKHYQKQAPQTKEKLHCVPVVKPSTKHKELSYIWRRIELGKCNAAVLPKVAVFLAQQARQQHGKECDVAFTIPVDMRGLRTDRLQANTTSTANLTGYFDLKIEAGETPRQVMRDLHQQIKHYADCYINPALKIIPWLPIKFLARKLKANIDHLLYKTNDSLASGGLVSLGLISPTDYCYPGFKAHSFFAIPGSVGRLNVVIIQNGDKTQYTFCSPAAYNSDGQLDGLLDKFGEFMEKK